MRRWALVALMMAGIGATILPWSPGLAQGIAIRDVQVDGIQRIDVGTVLSYLNINPGDAFDEKRIDTALKTLFATGLFADVNIRREGDVLVVKLVENPIINRIAFEGNRKLKDESLEKEIQLKPRQVYTRSKVQSDLQRILTLYRRGGRFAATVEPKVIQLPQNRVDLVFEINEGSLTSINRIRFVGNKRFGDGKLREAITTKESRWWRFLSSDDTYDPDRLTYDRELLRRYYLARGHADFRVINAVAELAPSREGFFVTFAVDEGEVYKFGKVEVVSYLRNVDAARLKSFLDPTQKGDVYNADAVEKVVQNLTDELGRLGYAFVDIQPETERNRDGKVIDVTYTINESPRVYVERINIAGNVRTLDKVIRREFRLAEGDAFNTAKLRRSRTRLRNLAFFEKVDVNEVRGSTPDKVVINVDVTEKSTGDLSFGVGYSTTDSILADVTLRERNLLGTAQDVRLGVGASRYRKQLDFGYTEPYFLDRELAAGFDLLYRDQDLQRISGYKMKTEAFTLRSGYPITEHLSQQPYYRLRHDDVYDFSSTASVALTASGGSMVTSAVGHNLLYDERDDRLLPSSGYFVRLSQEFAGVGGSERYIKNVLGGGVYYPITDDVVYGLTSEAGIVNGIDRDVRLNNRFYVGGDNLRGFRTGGIGPRVANSTFSLGGNRFYTVSNEIRFPLGLPNEFGILGRAFVDAGSLWQVDVMGLPITVLDSQSIRASAGFGISWKSPFGPIRVDAGVPFRKEPYDVREVIRFNFGNRF